MVVNHFMRFRTMTYWIIALLAHKNIGFLTRLTKSLAIHASKTLRRTAFVNEPTVSVVVMTLVQKYGNNVIFRCMEMNCTQLARKPLTPLLRLCQSGSQLLFSYLRQIIKMALMQGLEP